MTQSHPDGYTLIYTSEQPEFADLLRSVLEDEGYSVYQAGVRGGGIFRVNWGSEIYVDDRHAEEAKKYLDDYLNRQAAETPAEEDMEEDYS